MKKHIGEYDKVAKCTGRTWKDQENCDYAEKSKFRDCCIYFIEDSTRRCDNPDVEEIARSGK
jgi:hypothetical protein